MKNIFRIPVDNQHFRDTIENGKPVGEISQFLSGEQKARIQKIAKEGMARYWGSIPGENNKRNFEHLGEGDEMLCYRSGQYIALAKIAFTAVNRELAKYSWGVTEVGATWELIYFFSDVKYFQVDSGVINKEFGFKDGPVMGFSAISEEKAREFIAKYGSVESFINSLGYQERVQEKISQEISKLIIHSPFEAQFYLVDLGNQLNFETYVPPSDAGHEAFGKKLGELITVRKEDLSQYVAPVILDPLSTIDVIWFKGNYQPKFFYEVIHRTGWSEALLRLDLVSKHYESADVRIVGPKENQPDFGSALRKWAGPREGLKYKDYDQLVNVHSESLYLKKVVDEFLY